MAGGAEKKLDMSLDDLVKAARKAKPAGAKPAGAKPTGAKAGAKAGKATGKAAKAAAAGAALGKGAKKAAAANGAAPKAKGGVTKGGQAGKAKAVKVKGKPDVRVVPRPGAARGPGGRGAGPSPPGAWRAPPGARRSPPRARGMPPPHHFMGPPPFGGPPPPAMLAMQQQLMLTQQQLALAQQQAAAAARARPSEQQAAWQHDRFDAGSSGALQTAGTSTKLLVSNLGQQVSQEDISELFATVGPLREAHLLYDKSGTSLGTAHVVFTRREHALAAASRYHNVALDGKKMVIEVVEAAVPAGTFKTLSSGINVSSAAPAPGGFRGRGVPHGVDAMQM